MTIGTRFTKLFGLTQPVMSAPMAMHSGGRLAAAVCEAGGLGTFGGVQTGGPDWIREQMAHVRSRTEGAFGVGYITPFLPFMEPLFDAALEERAPVIVLSFAEVQPWLGRAKEAGASVICQVQSMEHARDAVDAGADALIAQGNEAGGHCGEASLMPLLREVIDAFPNVPVLAAGGISSGRALAEALDAGADGASLGTALLATPENVEVPEEYKRVVLAANGDDTAFTRFYDIIGEAPWPEWVGARVYRNRLVSEWLDRDDEARAHREELAALVDGNERDTDVAAVYMGRGVGDVTEMRPAADVVRSICDEAEALRAG